MPANQPAFTAATSSPALVRAVEGVVRVRLEITEAHLVAMRDGRRGADPLALIVLSETRSVIADLERELRSVLKPHVRPTVIHFTTEHPDLPWVRGLGGELKRETSGAPWWLLFLGI